MRQTGRGFAVWRGGLFFIGTGWLAIACGSPARDLGHNASDGSSGSGGTAANPAGSAAGKANGSAGRSTTGRGGGAHDDGGDGGTGSIDDSAGQGPVSGGAGGAAGVGGTMPVIVTDCTGPAERSCAEGGLLGTCASGKQTCGTDGHWGACSILPQAKDACATGNDDSCNGLVNEGCGCVNGTTQPCAGAKGNCAAGTQTCTNGVLSACTILPKAADLCTAGDDSDCDGTPNRGCKCDNGATQSCGVAAVGICKPGKSTCAAGAWGACAGEVVASTRNCSAAADNDCNGTLDNLIDSVCTCAPTKTQSCGAHAGLDGKGICKAGTQTCLAASNNASSSWGACSGAVGPATRNCGSTQDNDCNGTADNKDSTCACAPNTSQACQAHPGLDGKGICKAGTQTCSSTGGTSKWGNCTGYVDPTARNCTSTADNDCDGKADMGSGGACQCTSTSCPSGQVCSMSASASKCVTCNANSDCSNGASCVANACQCKSNYNGSHCEFVAFTGIGMASGDTDSFVRNISHDGSKVVGYSASSDGSVSHALVFSNGTLTTIREPANNSNCSSYSADSKGNVFGACVNFPFQYSNGVSSTVTLGSAQSGGVFDVSRDGNVLVGLAYDGHNQIPFRKVGTSLTLLPRVADDFGRAVSTSADGAVAVGDQYVFYHVGWYWTQASSTVQLPQQADFSNYTATDVSADGKVIVGYSDDAGGIGIKWSGSKYTTIQTSTGSYYSTSQDGSVSVGFTGDSDPVATLWDAQGIARSVASMLNTSNLSGWNLERAMAVSDDGKWVAGTGTHGSHSEGWVAHLP